MDIPDAKNDSALGVLQILATRKNKLITVLPMLSTKLKWKSNIFISLKLRASALAELPLFSECWEMNFKTGKCWSWSPEPAVLGEAAIWKKAGSILAWWRQFSLIPTFWVFVFACGMSCIRYSPFSGLKALGKHKIISVICYVAWAKRPQNRSKVRSNT